MVKTMKIKKYSTVILAAMALAACDEVNNMTYEGGSLTSDQLQEVNAEVPERAEALFNGLFSMMAKPNGALGGSRPDDWGFPMMCLSADLEASDAWIADIGYNWFSACGEWSTRNANYANPYIRYITPYKQIKIANDVLSSYSETSEDEDILIRRAQARALRAYDYMWLASAFQFNYADHKDEPCVPLVTENTLDAASNPRATVGEIYEQIIADLDYACEHLEGFSPANKSRVSGAVAFGLRARAYLAMEEWEKAAADAKKAIDLSGCTPATMAQISTPAFCRLDETNWMWGFDMTTDMANTYPFATVCSWLSSFSTWSYAGAGCFTHINKLLFDKIPATDVRKGWWLDENKNTNHLEGVIWDDKTGNEIIDYIIPDTKEAFDAYTNVKFGMKSGIGSEVNNSDFPFMRVEEMYLVQAEALVKSGRIAEGKSLLENFVKTYRDPSYNVDAKLAAEGLAANESESLANEIWFQRRVELWGEGFAMSDIMRLKKPVVRFHGNEKNPYPSAFQFNVAYGDPYMLLRFPQQEMDNNSALIDNKGGSQPSAGQNPELRDGVTD